MNDLNNDLNTERKANLYFYCVFLSQIVNFALSQKQVNTVGYSN